MPFGIRSISWVLILLSAILGSESYSSRGIGSNLLASPKSPHGRRLPVLQMQSISRYDAVNDPRKGPQSFKTSIVVQCISLFSYIYFHAQTLVSKEISFKLSSLPEFQLPADVTFGMATLLSMVAYRLLSKRATSTPFMRSVPWRRPRVRPLLSLLALIGIAIQFQVAGIITFYLSVMLDIMANFVPLTIPMQESLKILLSSLTWIVPSAIFLCEVVPGFTPNDKRNLLTTEESPISSFMVEIRDYRGNPVQEKKIENKLLAPRYGRKERKGYYKLATLEESDFYSFSFRSQWAWWAALGYLLSVSVFFFVDKLNMIILPSRFFRHHSLVEQVLSSPSLPSKLVALISPCIIAPIWEEVLYRGFILPWFNSIFPLPTSLFLTSVAFSLHHGRWDSYLPLFSLGLLWAIIYVQSKNLLVPILVHCIWNMQVFLLSH